MLEPHSNLSTSPWTSDPFLFKDDFVTLNSLLFGESENARSNSHPDLTIAGRSGSPVSSAHSSLVYHHHHHRSGFGTTSVASSSECSDEIYVRDEAFPSQEIDHFALLDVNGDETEFSDTLSVGNASQLEFFTAFGELDFYKSISGGGASHQLTEEQDARFNTLEEDDDELTIHSAPPSPTPSRKKARNHAAFQKTWSKMSNAEQMSSVEELSKIVSNEMSLREQLEIIRIINPDAMLSPADTEFAIDLGLLNDDKFRRIREIVRLHGVETGSSINCRCSDTSSECSASSSPPHKTKTGKKEMRRHRTQQRWMRQRVKKEQRQHMREKRSGLFQQNQIMALSDCLPEEENEIDIIS